MAGSNRKLHSTIYFARPYDLKEMTLAARIQRLFSTDSLRTVVIIVLGQGARSACSGLETLQCCNAARCCEVCAADRLPRRSPCL